jgi:hypothetical protein
MFRFLVSTYWILLLTVNMCLALGTAQMDVCDDVGDGGCRAAPRRQYDRLHDEDDMFVGRRDRGSSRRGGRGDVKELINQVYNNREKKEHPMDKYLNVHTLYLGAAIFLIFLLGFVYLLIKVRDHSDDRWANRPATDVTSKLDIRKMLYGSTRILTSDAVKVQRQTRTVTQVVHDNDDGGGGSLTRKEDSPAYMEAKKST